MYKTRIGGRIQQKKGSRLEKAIYQSMPIHMKNEIVQNRIFYNENGDAIVEYDMIYTYGDFSISFEIKGINEDICNDEFRQNKIIEQAIKQHEFIKSLNIKNQTVICLVTGNSTINNIIQSRLEEYNIIVAVGRFPKNVVNDAINKLKSLNIIS